MKFTYLLAACLPCALTFVLSTTVTPLRAQDAGAQFAMPQCGKLPITIQMHGTAVIGDRIYIFGGLDAKGWSDKVHSAPLLPNARVGAWREEKHLPDRRCYLVNCVEVVNDYVYLVGGLTSAQIDGKESALTRKNNVLYTKVLPGGILDDWKESVAMPPPAISLGASCSTDKFLLLTGGSAPPSIVSSNVLIADLSATGAPENWRVAGKMPASLWFHGAAILDGKIYVWGGLPTRDRKTTNHKVYSADLSANGTIGAWRELPGMPQPTYAASTCALNDYIISIGGRYAGSYPTNVIWYTRTTSDGIEPWKMLKTDLSARVYHSLGLDKSHGWVFITGGQNVTAPGVDAPSAVLDVIQAFQLSQPQAARLSSNDVSSAKTTSQHASEFLTLDDALQQAKKSNKPVLAFFYSPEVPASRRFWDTVATTPQYSALSSTYHLAAVDVSAPAGSAQAAARSLFRVPSIAVISPTGQLLNKITNLNTWEDVQKVIGKK